MSIPPPKQPKPSKENENACSCCIWCSMTGANALVYSLFLSQTIKVHEKCKTPYEKWMGAP